MMMRFGSLFGAKFTSTVATDDRAADWRVAWGVALAGMTGAQIKAGLTACAKRDWPPSAGEFIALCCPPPDYEHEFIEAAHGRWDGSRLRYWTAQGFGYYELRKMQWAQAQSRWIAKWHEFMDDEPLPPIPDHVENPPLALPAPARGSEMQRECMAKIRELTANPNRPSKDWAVRILENPRVYPRISDEFARIAVVGIANETAGGYSA